MAEEQGGEQIGRLWTEIGGDITPLDAVLAKAAEKLADFIKTEYKAKIGVQFENTGGSSARPQGLVDRHGKQLGIAIGQAALGEIETKISKIKDVKVETKPKIDKDTMVAAVQGSLNGHAFKLTLDQNFIREQIQTALGGHGFQVGVGGAAPGRVVAAPGGISPEQRAAFDAQFKAHRYGAVGGESASLGKLIEDWDKQLATMQKRTAPGGGPTAAFEDMLDQLGTDLSSWADKVEKIEPDTILGDILRQKINPSGTLYQDILAARGGRQTQEPSQASSAFVAQVAKKLAHETTAEPSTTASEVAASKTLAELKKVPFFQNKTSLQDLVKEIPSNKEPSPEFRAILSAALSADRNVSDAIPGGKNARSRRYGGRGFVRELNNPLPTGADTEADLRADQQLGTDRANTRRLRGRLAGTQGIPFDLEGLARLLERGGLRNIAREEKTGQLHELTPRGTTPGELQESELALRELRRRTGNRRFSLPGIKNQLTFLKPQDVVQQIIEGMFGGDTAANILSSPQVQRTISQSIRQGAANKPFNFLGASAGATRLGGKSVEASAREVLRLQSLVKQNDQHMADVETRLEALAGSGRPTDRLEDTLNRLGLRGQKLRSELEAVTPNTDRNLSAADRKILAAGSSRSRAESRANIEGNVGLSPLELALKQEKSPETIAHTIATKMREGLLPAYETLIETISDSLANAQPVEEGGRNPFIAGRDAAIRQAHESLSKAYGFTDESGGQVKGRGEDRQLFEATFSEALNEARSTAFQQRQEGDRAVDLAHAGTGKGRRPKTQIGSHVDLAKVSVGGAAVTVPDYARPTTSLDTEEASLRKQYDEAARTIAQGRLDALQQSRQKEFHDPNTGRFRSGKDLDFDKVGIEDILYAPRIRKTGGGTTPKEIKPDIRAEVESTTDVGKRIAEIRRIRAEAAAAIQTAGPAIPLASGRKRSTADDRTARIKELGLDPAVEKEALEVLRQNARGARTPYTKAGREVPTGDQTVERYAAAIEGRPVNRVIGGGAGGGGTTGAGGTTGGGGFGGFPIPLPVLVTNDILRVSVEGGGGSRAASAASKAEDEVAAPAETAAVAIRGVSQLPKRLRYKVPGFEDPYNKIGSAIKFVDKGLSIAGTPITQLENPSLGRQRQTALVAAAREAARPARPTTRSARVLTDFDLRSQYLDQAQDQIETISGEQRKARRLVPSRGFGASVTDALTAVFGGKGFEQQLGRLSRVEAEGAELKTLRTQQASLLAERAVLQRRNGPGDSARIAEIEPSLKGMDDAIQRSTEIFTQNYKELSKGTNVLKGFTAAAAGSVGNAIAGSITFGLGLAVTGPIIQAIGEGLTTAIGTGVSEVFGHPEAETKIVGSLSDAIRGTGGRAGLALAQLSSTTGNALPSVNQPLSQRAEIEAGNKALADQVGELRAILKIQSEGGPGAALTQSLGGFLGGPLGGIPSIDEVLGKQLLENPSIAPSGAALVKGQTGGAQFGPRTAGQRVGEVEQGLTTQQTQLLETNLKGLNDILGKNNKNLDRFVSAADIDQSQLAKQAAALRQIGAENLAQAVEQRKGAITENGALATDPSQLQRILLQTVQNATKLSPQDFLALQEPQIRAQQYLTRRQLQFNLQQAPIQEGLDRSANPNLPATAGFAPADAKRYKTELSGVQSTFDSLAKDAAQARTDAVTFFQNAFPGDTSDAKAFADSLQKSAQYGQQIAKIQIGVETAQAAFEAKQYSFQIFEASRSLRDAKGLTGQITNDTKNLGVIERQQFELQRDSQALSLGMSQRQINFQRAIAGLTAPGLTGEERAARIEQAKLEADYAQKQLDIQKKLFGLGGRQFKITADRNVQDLARQLGLLQQGREVTLRTAVAAKQIAALTQLQARENKRISAFYQAAVDATGQVMQLEAQLVANTEVGLNKVGNLVLDQFRKVYTGLIHDLGGTTSSRQQEDTGTPHASGILGMAAGATNLGIAGEAGNETVAILRNPRPFNAGGGGTSVVIDLRGSQVSTEDDRRKLIAEVQSAVERGLTRKGSVLGLR